MKLSLLFLFFWQWPSRKSIHRSPPFIFIPKYSHRSTKLAGLFGVFSNSFTLTESRTTGNKPERITQLQLEKKKEMTKQRPYKESLNNHMPIIHTSMVQSMPASPPTQFKVYSFQVPVTMKLDSFCTTPMRPPSDPYRNGMIYAFSSVPYCSAGGGPTGGINCPCP